MRGEAYIARPPARHASTTPQWGDYVFMRKNPQGLAPGAMAARRRPAASFSPSSAIPSATRSRAAGRWAKASKIYARRSRAHERVSHHVVRTRASTAASPSSSRSTASPTAAMPAIRWPRRCWPTACAWWRAASSMAARAASSARAPKSPTRWCSLSAAHGTVPNLQVRPRSSCTTGLRAARTTRLALAGFDVKSIIGRVRALHAGGFLLQDLHGAAKLWPLFEHVSATPPAMAARRSSPIPNTTTTASPSGRAGDRRRRLRLAGGAGRGPRRAARAAGRRADRAGRLAAVRPARGDGQAASRRAWLRRQPGRTRSLPNVTRVGAHHRLWLP